MDLSTVESYCRGNFSAEFSTLNIDQKIAINQLWFKEMERSHRNVNVTVDSKSADEAKATVMNDKNSVHLSSLAVSERLTLSGQYLQERKLRDTFSTVESYCRGKFSAEYPELTMDQKLAVYNQYLNESQQQFRMALNEDCR